jgi:hypothetical protein
MGGGARLKDEGGSGYTGELRPGFEERIKFLGGRQALSRGLEGDEQEGCPAACWIWTALFVTAKTNSGIFVNRPEDVVIFPEAVKMMRGWKKGGGRIIAVSNQDGIALGHMIPEINAAAMMRTHELTDRLFDKICWCSHHPSAKNPEMARCWCLKPSPGLIIEGALDIARQFNEYYPPYMG